MALTGGNTNEGAGIYIKGASPIIKNCVLLGNRASSIGGGLYSDANLYLHHWSGGSVGSGDPIYWSIGASPTVEKCVFEENHAVTNGAAIYLSDTSPEITDNPFFHVEYVVRGTPKVRQCRIIGNTSQNSSAVRTASYVEALLENCAVAGNKCRGIENVLARMTVRNCTISENLETGNGAGVYAIHDTSYPGYTKLQNTIVWGNAPSDHQVYAPINNNLCTIDYTCHNGAYPGPLPNYISLGAGNIVADPLLCRNGDINIVSPVINTGNPAYAPPVDIYGQARDSQPDMGCQEYADADNDGLPDTWEKTHFGNTTAGQTSDNPDGDELTNLQEYNAGTDPQKKAGDSDRDGLTDDAEKYYRTDPKNWDSDGDLFPDGWETKYNFDPNSTNSPSPTADADSDGLNNFDEMRHGSDPTKAETDGDGVHDGAEVSQGSDPADAGDAGKAENCVRIELAVGDHSGSHSERYALKVGDNVSHVAPEFGVVASNTYAFVKGKAYSFEIRWMARNIETPDYDYTALVGGFSGSGSSTNGYIVDDPSGILGQHDESDPFFAEEKTGTLYVVKLDIATDINNDGTIDATDEPIEESGIGEIVRVNDNNDPASGEDDLQYMKVKIEPTLTQGVVWFTYDTNKVAIWKNLTRTQPIASGSETAPTWNLGLGDIIPDHVYIEGITSTVKNASIDLILHLKIGGTEYTDTILFTVTDQVGHYAYFRGVKDYLVENNAKVFLDDVFVSGGFSTKADFVLVGVRSDKATLKVVDAKTPDLADIGQVMNDYPQSHIIANGTFYHLAGGILPSYGPWTYGKIIEGGSELPISSNTPYAITYRGWFAQKIDGSFTWARGSEPSPTSPTKSAIGGMAAFIPGLYAPSYLDIINAINADNPSQFTSALSHLGLADENGEGILFLLYINDDAPAAQAFPASVDRAGDLFPNLVLSGTSVLFGLDGGGSVGVAHVNLDGSLDVTCRAWRQKWWLPTPDKVNNYIVITVSP
ncbi:MAG: hypothetical protein E4H40_00575 [Candidatus Brocadiia bacterium]|nr:MAG: hypothetical protein E4H40_00575 [Candidatus Brocadiia bacterium]